jgi:hypothetical protein
MRIKVPMPLPNVDSRYRGKIMRRFSLLRLSTVVGCLSAIAPTIAQAVVYCGPAACNPSLPAPYAAVTVDSGITSIAPPGGVYPTEPSYTSASIGFSPTPTTTSLSHLGSTITPGKYGTASSAIFDYWLEVVSNIPTPSDTLVPLIITGEYSLQADADFEFGQQIDKADAGIAMMVEGADFDTIELSKDISSECINFDCRESTSANYNYVRTANVGSTLAVTLVAHTDAEIDPDSIFTNTALASAAVDPIFMIDPSFADASNYSIVVSAGVGNMSPVSESNNWLLMLTGLGIFVGLSRACRSFDK